MHVGTKDLSAGWRGLVREYPGFSGLSITWRVVKPRGYDSSRPYTASVYLGIRDRHSGKVLAEYTDDFDLALKGQTWTVRYFKPSLHVDVPIDGPLNIACDLAVCMSLSRQSTGKWERIEALLARSDRWVEPGLIVTPLVKSFRSRVDEANGKVRLVLSCGQDGNDYSFDPDGLEDPHRPPIVVPTAGRRDKAPVR